MIKLNPNEFKFKHICSWVDELAILGLGIFILGLMWHIQLQSQKIQEMS